MKIRFINFKILLFLVVLYTIIPNNAYANVILKFNYYNNIYGASVVAPTIPLNADMKDSKYYNLHQAAKYEEEKNYDAAIIEYKNVLNIEPANLIANYNLSIHYYNKWMSLYRRDIKNSESEKYLNESLNYLMFIQQLNPNLTMTYIKLGRIFTIKGELDSAILFYKKGIEVSPTNYMLYFNLASIYETLDDTNMAIYNYKKCIELNKTLPHAYNNLALLYESIGSDDEAIKYYKHALNIDNNYIYSLVNLGNLLAKDKNYDEAYKYLMKAIVIDPNNPWVYLYLGNYYESKKMYDMAYGSYIKFIKMKPTYAKGYYLLCNILIKLNKQSEALTAGVIYLKLEPKGKYSNKVEEIISKIKNYSPDTVKLTS